MEGKKMETIKTDRDAMGVWYSVTDVVDSLLQMHVSHLVYDAECFNTAICETNAVGWAIYQWEVDSIARKCSDVDGHQITVKATAYAEGDWDEDKMATPDKLEAECEVVFSWPSYDSDQMSVNLSKIQRELDYSGFGLDPEEEAELAAVHDAWLAQHDPQGAEL